MEETKYLIIGNGIAGLSAAKEIRKRDKEGSIVMVTREPYLTYYRIKLTEYIGKDFQDDDLLVNGESWYKENNIKILLSKIVENLDVDNNKIRLDDSREIGYEKLLLATGSRPFIPPIAGKYKQGVVALRTLDDLIYIKNYFSECENIVVVGGGILGLEAAWSLKTLGKEVSVIGRSSHLMPKQLDEEIGNKLEERLTEEGIKIYLSSTVDEILGKSQVNGLRLDNGIEIKTDSVLFSTGIIPSIDIVRNTPIEFNKGIIVDNNLKTNVDNVYAAGDSIEVNGKSIGLWTSSNEQGRIAGSNMAGKPMEYTGLKPFTTLRLGDIKIFSVGDIEKFDKVYEYRDEDKSIHHKLFTSDGKITGGILFGDIKDMGKLKNAVTEKVSIDSYLEDNLPFV
ncbi:MAG: NAD(P)/FAD-dependent oxidoreductase [Tissierellia bacterium]|nr:NAD(P)/FAD-dependent oxidoreductase [Tissierellia bacterium]